MRDLNAMRLRQGIIILVAAALLPCTGCSILRGVGAGAPLADSLDALMPHGDRDHFVYIWQKVADGQRLAEGIHVEHVTRTAESDEFDMVLSEDGVPAIRLHMRDDGQALALIDEDDLSQQIRMTFSPPLTQYEIPLVGGERIVRSTVSLTSLANEASIASVEVSQVVRMASARNVRSAIGSYDKGVGVEVRRTLHWPWGDAAYESTIMLVPGIGEIRSEASSGKGFIVRRELACAMIKGRPVGDCASIEERLREIRNAGQTDAP